MVATVFLAADRFRRAFFAPCFFAVPAAVERDWPAFCAAQRWRAASAIRLRPSGLNRLRFVVARADSLTLVDALRPLPEVVTPRSADIALSICSPLCFQLRYDLLDISHLFSFWQYRCISA